MRISEYFSLNRTQPTLDFVDVDVRGDISLFIDPRALRISSDSWSHDCVSTIQNFFQTILALIQRGDQRAAINLLSLLREPNETHLGLSKDKSNGKALGDLSSVKVWESLARSEAAKSGLLVDLEDSILMIEGISSDIISDMTTNIIRRHLIKYTQTMADYYSIPLQQGIVSGPLWNTETRQWENKYVSLPVADDRKLLLVPKSIVRRKMDYNVSEYYTQYILDHLRNVELNSNTELVHLLKNGRLKVYSNELIEKYGAGKRVIVRETLENPEILELYRRDKADEGRPPLDHFEISEKLQVAAPDWNALVNNVLEVSPGQNDSHNYENAIESFLTALFYPSLAFPVKQHRIHNGRKRIDISYSNNAYFGFFHWLALHFPSANIFVECKNYSGEIGNPELDQLGGRFSPSRGQVGILVCRSVDDKNLFLQRCKDTAMDSRGFILVLDDEDLQRLAEERISDPQSHEFVTLRRQFEQLIN